MEFVDFKRNAFSFLIKSNKKVLRYAYVYNQIYLTKIIISFTVESLRFLIVHKDFLLYYFLNNKYKILYN